MARKLGNTEDTMCVGKQLGTNLFERLAADLSDALDDERSVHALVPSAAKWHGGDVGSIGFAEEHVERSVFYHFIVIVGEGDDAREGKGEAEIEELLGDSPISGKKVYVAW